MSESKIYKEYMHSTKMKLLRQNQIKRKKWNQSDNKMQNIQKS